MDGDTKNSTYSKKIKKVSTDNYIECYIAEQNLVGVAIGAACRDRTVAFCSTFAAFFTRTFDQIRMGALSQKNINCVGSHAGVSIGEDGPSQMALEDLAMFRTIPGCTVFYPNDAVSCERACELEANTRGICFIRTSRPATVVIYNNEALFQVGKAQVVRENPGDKIVLIVAGITMHEGLKAADTLATNGIHVCVIDPYTIKPLDADTIRAHALRVGGKILTVEDHYPEGGIGETVACILSTDANITVKRLAVDEVPRSCPPEVLFEKYGNSSNCIVNAVYNLLQ
ncbi:hypothetical protein QYM36_006543 [Artemia franciscana]|uniref:transketolase n=1 Tax=Artemia franciscana TaxID=6661 RepID=A0AA88HYW7_ARTSF|nr:hypothetical protein QYM36_006543 [Artemia franciscana]